MRYEPYGLIEHVKQYIDLIRHELDKVDDRGSVVSEIASERPEQYEVDKARSHASARRINGIDVQSFFREDVIVHLLFSGLAEDTGEVELLDVFLVRSFGYIAEIRRGVALIDGDLAVSAIREEEIVDEREYGIDGIGRYPRLDIRERIAGILFAFLEAAYVVGPRYEEGLASCVEILRGGVDAADVTEQRAHASLRDFAENGAAYTADRIGYRVDDCVCRLTLCGVDYGVKHALTHGGKVFVLGLRYAVLGVARVVVRLLVAHARSVGNIGSETDADTLEETCRSILAALLYPFGHLFGYEIYFAEVNVGGAVGNDRRPAYIHILVVGGTQFEEIFHVGSEPVDREAAVGIETVAFHEVGLTVCEYRRKIVTRVILHVPGNVFGSSGNGIFRHSVVVIALAYRSAVYLEPYFHSGIYGHLLRSFYGKHESVDDVAVRAALRGERSDVHYGFVAVADSVIIQRTYLFGDGKRSLGLGTGSIRVLSERGDEGRHRRFHIRCGSEFVHVITYSFAVGRCGDERSASVDEFVVEGSVELGAYLRHRGFVVLNA